MRTPKRPRNTKLMWKRPQGPPELEERKVPPEDNWLAAQAKVNAENAEIDSND